jgi:transcriptional regulator with GAF, ATPase, and Fis domain
VTKSYDEIVLLSDYPKDRISSYIKWLEPQTPSNISIHYHSLSGPTQFGEIYEAVIKTLSEVQKRYGDVDLTFHLSPGTPAMAAVWILLAKTYYSAELVESSKEQGVKIVEIPFDISAEFIPSIMRHTDERLEKLSVGLPPDAPEFDNIIHRSAVMKRIIAKARRVAPRSVSILIEGESGTGKELLARAIHRASSRRDKPFVTVNCGAIPSELVESEFFGHKKGAFTSAVQDRVGYFEAAHEGSLFLDEIGDLPLAAQVKILRALQEREIVRVGEIKTIKIDVRIIAATNRKLIEEVAANRFRADLYYRLAVAVLGLPPLRERSGDLSLLIDRLLDEINRESIGEPGYINKKISASARNLMLSYHWPGNVRELLNTLRRAAVWSSDSTISVEDINDSLIQPQTNAGKELPNESLVNGVNLPEILSNIAGNYLTQALKTTGGNKTKAAELLGLPNYQTLSNWLNKYGVDK